tara:strand:+ start:1162 stop:1737 length:576 start_codon:yes stop_codon:yes gene_type:complete
MPIILPNHKLDDIINIVFSELGKGASRKKHPFKNVVLTTVNKKIPMSRWVVFRKLTSLQNILIYTDFRSQKIKNLENNTNCGLLFYNNKQGLQIYFNTKSTIHQKNDLTKKYWHGIVGTSSENYSNKYSPGTPINNIDEGHKIDKDLDDKYFSIIELCPIKMNILQLSRNGHIRASFSKNNNEWKGSFIVP